MPRARIFIVSPFIDKRHGTERRIAEWITRLPTDYEIHIYSQRVEDVDLTRMRWHRIPRIPGPHLVNFLWWLGANHLWRWWDAHARGLRPQRRGEALVGEHAGKDSAGKVLQGEDRFLGVRGELRQQEASVRGCRGGRAPQPGGERDELLLDTVVQVALDAPPLLVLDSDEPLA